MSWSISSLTSKQGNTVIKIIGALNSIITGNTRTVITACLQIFLDEYSYDSTSDVIVGKIKYAALAYQYCTNKKVNSLHVTGISFCLVEKVFLVAGRACFRTVCCTHPDTLEAERIMQVQKLKRIVWSLNNNTEKAMTKSSKYTTLDVAICYGSHKVRRHNS